MVKGIQINNLTFHQQLRDNKNKDERENILEIRKL